MHICSKQSKEKQTNKQTRMIENKQRQPPPFLFQLNSEQTDMCTFPIKTARTSIFSSHSLDEVAFLIFCPPPVLLSPSCQYRPKASDIVRAKSGLCILHSALLLPKPHRGLWLYIVYNTRYSLPEHCAIRPYPAKKSDKKARAPPSTDPDPQKVSICPFFTISSSQPSPTPSCLQSTWPDYFFFSATTSLSSAWSPYNRVQM